MAQHQDPRTPDPVGQATERHREQQVGDVGADEQHREPVGREAARLEKGERRLPHLEETTWRAVEQRLEGYAPWTGPSSALPRVTIDSVQSLGSNVEAALAFIAS